MSSRYREIVNKIFAGLFFIALVSFNNDVFAQDGKALFKANCASCHKPDKDYTGPALQGWKGRQPDGWVYKWVAGPSAVIASGDKYANELYGKWKQNGMMSAFAQLKKEEIDAILKYVDDYKPEDANAPKGGVTAPAEDFNLGFSSYCIYIITGKYQLTQTFRRKRGNPPLRTCARLQKQSLPDGRYFSIVCGGWFLHY
jgi:cytochrome c551/c552